MNQSVLHVGVKFQSYSLDVGGWEKYIVLVSEGLSEKKWEQRGTCKRQQRERARVSVAQVLVWRGQSVSQKIV